MKLSQLAALFDMSFSTGAEFTGVSIDTRTLQAGQLFVAIVGAHFDGHHFLEEAVKKGASALLIEKDTPFLLHRETSIPYLKVKNTIQALGKLAAYHRSQFNMPVVGITGSCGKTTTRAFVASILSEVGNTLFSEKSYNNDIGVPLTLLRLVPEHQYAVIEMGANHFGEIAYLTNITKPDVAIITNAAEAHLEGFGDVDGVCRAKGEIFQGLSQRGVAILNADSPYFKNWQTMAQPAEIISFGINQGPDIQAKYITSDENNNAHFTCITPSGEIDIQVPLAGEHNVSNALAAVAAAYALKVPLQIIQTGLSKATAVNSRLNYHLLKNGTYVIDDTYNANPLSVKAAIALLAQRAGKKILVLGDMKELGEHTKSAHQEAGLAARESGINALYTYGDQSLLSSETFGENGLHFKDQIALIEALRQALQHNVGTILIKGSRSMQMECVVNALRAL